MDLQRTSSSGLEAGQELTPPCSSEVEFFLQSCDVVVFMTDGIIEAHDAQGKEYQDSGQLQQVLIQLSPEMSAEAMVDVVIDNVIAYSGETTQREDDITGVVVKVR